MEITQIKARDGVDIPCGVWGAEGNIILYMHGVESHMGWFHDMADQLQDRGFCVYAFDRRGSGLSKETRGHIDNYKTFLDDIYDVIKNIRRQYPGRKIFLMGVCGGGKFAANFASYIPEAIEGLILISPAIKTKITLPFAKKLDVLISSFVNPKKKIPTPLHNDMFTKNKRFIDFINEDKLSLHHLTARFYRELILMDIALAGRIFKIEMPILTLLAEDDDIVDNNGMQRWHKRLKTPDKTIKLFSGTCHFLPFQEDLTEIINFVADWIEKRARRL